MRNIREMVKEQSPYRIARAIAKNNLLWDGLTNLPDFYCSSINDIKENIKDVGTGRSILLKRVEYQGKGDKTYFIEDATGELEIEPNFIQDKRLNSLTKGEFLYDIFIIKKRKNLCLADFETRGPICIETDTNYLTNKFPNLVPILSSSQ